MISRDAGAYDIVVAGTPCLSGAVQQRFWPAGLYCWADLGVTCLVEFRVERFWRKSNHLDTTMVGGSFMKEMK